MFKNIKDPNTLSAPLIGDTFTTVSEDFEIETGTFEVTGTGQIRITNTGGSSASEGGMGSDSDDDQAKGDLKNTGGTGKDVNKAADEDDSDTAFDPIKKKVREAEKKFDND